MRDKQKFFQKRYRAPHWYHVRAMHRQSVLSDIRDWKPSDFDPVRPEELMKAMKEGKVKHIWGASIRVSKLK